MVYFPEEVFRNIASYMVDPYARERHQNQLGTVLSELIESQLPNYILYSQECPNSDGIGFPQFCYLMRTRDFKSLQLVIECRECGEWGWKHDWNDDDDDMEYGLCGECDC